MRSKLIPWFIIFLVLILGVNAKITEEEKKDVDRTLEQWADNPEMLDLYLSEINNRFDLSDEPEVRQKIISAIASLWLPIGSPDPFLRERVYYATGEDDEKEKPPAYRQRGLIYLENAPNGIGRNFNWALRGTQYE